MVQEEEAYIQKLKDSGIQGGQSQARCTGAALSVALGLVEATCPQSSAGKPNVVSPVYLSWGDLG